MILLKFSKSFVLLFVIYFVQTNLTSSLQAQNIQTRSDIVEDPSPAYSLTLPQVNVTNGKEDPAYAIMRRAVAAAPLNRMPFSMYEAKVYSKATLVIDKVPRLLRYAGELSDELKKVKQGDVYTQEQLMRVTNSKEQLKCVILSRRSSFPKEFDGDFSSDFISINPYETGDIVSPVSEQGFATYKFRLQNILTLPDYRTVYRIEIIPRIKSPFTFSGTIDILDSLWNIVGFNLSGKIDLQIFSGTYTLKQNYKEIEPRLWVPDKANLSVNASAMGIKATMKLSASSTVEKYTRSTVGMRDIAAGKKSNIANNIAKAQAAASKVNSKKTEKKIEKIDQKLDEISEKEKLSTRDALKVMSLIQQKAALESGNDKDELEIKRRSYVRRKDSTVLSNTDTLAREWTKARNDMPLETDEIESYREDSIASTKKPKLFNADGSFAIGGNKNKKKKEKKKSNVDFSFSLSRPLFVYKDKKHNIEYRAFTIRNMFTFNPVDGVLLVPEFSLEKRFSKAKGKSKDMELKFEVQSGYAFASKFVPVYSSLKWLYAPRNAGNIKIEGGTWHCDFNTVSPTHPYHIAWGALLGHRSYSQYYHRSYVKATHSIEIFNGFDTRVSFDYEWRNPLTNHTEFSFFFPKSRKYQENVPINAAISDANSVFLAAGQTAHTELEISYTPKRYYRFQGNKKISLHSNYPTISALWRKGFSLTGSNGNSNGSDFDYLQFSINQTIHKTMLHTFRYKVYGGFFPDNRKMHFSEFAHPALMGTIFLEDWFGYYQVLRDYKSFGGNYRASTNEWIAGAFFNYDAMYLLVKWIPGINNTLIRENLYLSYLETPTVKHYFEVGYSINKIFMFADIGVSVAFEENPFPRNAANATKGWGYSGWRIHLRLRLGV